MSWRRQLAVAPGVSIGALWRAVRASRRDSDVLHAGARDAVARRFGSRNVVLTDSGTSALVLALRLAARGTRVVGLPAYSCVDLAAAARYADVRVRLYDIDPSTLSPDLDSVEQLVRRGVDAIVVAHLFGYPADVAGVRRIAAQHGVRVIEDAAQAASGRLHDAPLGSLGELSVLSFGRGKGLNAGGGGALLNFGSAWAEPTEAVATSHASRGLGVAGTLAVQWALGRPSIYGAPAAIPWLHIGEMVYHRAHEPAALSRVSAWLVADAFEREEHAAAGRTRRAAELERAVRAGRGVMHVSPVRGGTSGYLRFAVVDSSGERGPAAALAIARPYPRAFVAEPDLRQLLVAGEPAMPGADALRRALFTLPTHALVSDRDVAAMARWMGVARSGA